MKRRYLYTLLSFFIYAGLQAQTFVLNGSATAQGNDCYHLTPDAGGQSGSMFSSMPINLTQPFSFSARLYFGTKDGNGADGIVFILATTNTALGTGGGGIGYEGITPSIAIEYDDYFNSNFNDPTPDHMAVISSGSVSHTPPTNLTGPINLSNIEDGEDHCFSVAWDPVTMTLGAALDDDNIFYTGDIINTIFSGNPNVYFGFSAGTGSLSNIHRVCIGPPELEPMQDVTICEGESVTLQADENGMAWSWEPDPTLTPLNVSDPTATPDVTTTYVVEIEYACAYYHNDTVKVVVIPAPNATADNTSPVCLGESIGLFASGGFSYVWSGPNGFSSSQQNPVINNATINHEGLYTVTVTDANGCTNTATTEVELFPEPFVEINPISLPLCETGDPVQLTGSPSGGDWGGTISPAGVFDPSLAGEGDFTITYTITDGNGCTNSDEIVVEVVPNIPAEITPPGPFCPTKTVVTLSANPPGGDWGGAANSDGEIYPSTLGPGTHFVTYQLTGPDECYDTEILIEVLDIPQNLMVPSISPVCQDVPPFQLTGFPPGGMWLGPGAPSGWIDPSTLAPGDYVNTYFFGDTSCSNSAWNVITILDAPDAQNPVFECDSLGSMYTISFEITGGDTTSYQVVGSIGGTILPGSPAIFTSNPIPSGSTYQLQVFDNNHCDTVTISGAYTCNCGISAGLLDLTPLRLCAHETAIIIPPTGTVMGAEDTLLYVLHTGDPKNYILTGDPNTFRLTPPLQIGVTYFVSVIVGNTISGVGVDLTDPCLAVTPGKPVTWFEIPNGGLSAPPVICSGDSFQLVFNLSGNSPFDVAYSDGMQIFFLDSIVSGHTILFKPDSTITIQLISVENSAIPHCVVLLDTAVTILVADALLTQWNVSICPGDSMFLANQFQHQPGIYHDTLTASIGCDSIVETALSLYSLDTTRINSTSCDMGQVGVFEQIQTDLHGCDSTVITTVTFVEADTTHLNSASCDPQMTGVFITPLIGQDGCDSILIETISLLPTDTTHLASGSCDPGSTGLFTQVLTNIHGCDSVVMEIVALLPSDTVNLSSTSCFPADTGIATLHFQNSFGCDSLVIETTSLSPSYHILHMASTCDPDEAGVFVDHLLTVQGCDSMITLMVELLPSDTITSQVISCDPSMTGTDQYNFANQYGCDSVIIVMTTLAPIDSCVTISRKVYVPDVFSPNGDGINDLFFIIGGPEVLSRINFLRIYDRWGNLLMERNDFLPNDPQLGWDGTSHDLSMNPGVYAWIAGVEYVDGVKEVLYGGVTLIR